MGICDEATFGGGLEVYSEEGKLGGEEDGTLGDASRARVGSRTERLFV